MKTIKELHEAKEELECLLEEFSHWVNCIPSMHKVSLDYRKWMCREEEQYVSHYIDNGIVHIMLDYVYQVDEDFSTTSHISAPIEWIETYREGGDNKDILEKMLLQMYINYNQKELDKHREAVRVEAIELGLFRSTF